METKPAEASKISINLSTAEEIKQEGNTLYSQGQDQEAIKKYAKILLYVNGLVSKDEAMAHYSKNLVNDQEKDQIDELKHSAYINMAAAYLRLKNYQKVIEKSKLALEIRENPKAYYRRALACIELGDIDLAHADLYKFKQLSPNDSVIPNLEAKLISKSAEISTIEKQRFRGFFDKLNLND